MRTPEGRAEEHALAPQVAAVLELAFHFRRAVGPFDRLADAAADLRSNGSDGHDLASRKVGMQPSPKRWSSVGGIRSRSTRRNPIAP